MSVCYRGRISRSVLSRGRFIDPICSATERSVYLYIKRQRINERNRKRQNAHGRPASGTICPIFQN